MQRDWFHPPRGAELEEGSPGEREVQRGGAPLEPRKRARLRRAFFQVAPFLVVLGVGAAVVFLLFATRPSPPAQKPRPEGVLVEVTPVRAGEFEVDIRAQGQVIAANEVQLSPQISGEIVWINDALEPGGMVKQGEPLVRIDAEQYRLALSQAQAEVQQARVNLREQLARRRASKREWELLAEMGDVPKQRPNPLAFNEPQIGAARQLLESAQSALERARLDLERTTLSAPFDAFVAQEQAALGRIVSPGQALATLVGTEAFWVNAPIPVEKVAFVEPGAPARVWAETREGRIVRDGEVLRIRRDLGETGKLAQVLIRLPQPLGLQRGEPGPTRPLLLGAWVQVGIDAGTLKDVMAVPRDALREGDQVFVRGRDGRLQIREVDVVWEQPERVLVRSGLRPGEQLVVSRISEPVEGMVLRTRPREPAREDAPPSRRPGVGRGRPGERR